MSDNTWLPDGPEGPFQSISHHTTTDAIVLSFGPQYHRGLALIAEDLREGDPELAEAIELRLKSLGYEPGPSIICITGGTLSPESYAKLEQAAHKLGRVQLHVMDGPVRGDRADAIVIDDPSAMDQCREVAKAWAAAWENEDEDGPPNICEGCSFPAVTSDSEGIGLCQACANAMNDEAVETGHATRVTCNPEYNMVEGAFWNEVDVHCAGPWSDNKVIASRFIADDDRDPPCVHSQVLANEYAGPFEEWCKAMDGWPAEAPFPLLFHTGPAVLADPFEETTFETITVAESSNIAKVEYRRYDQVLRVTFKGGKAYEYQGVPSQIVALWSQAQSSGKFFHSNIRKGEYECVKVSQ